MEPRQAAGRLCWLPSWGGVVLRAYGAERLRDCRENHDLHGAVLAGRYNHPARFWVVAHRFCASFCGDLLDRGIFVRRILMEDEDFAIACRKVDEFCRWIPRSGVDTIADGSREDHFSAVRIEYGEVMAAAADEEPVVILIE